MPHTEEVLLKGTRLTERIRSLCAEVDDGARRPARLELSFDQFCMLLEYTSLMGEFKAAGGHSLEELMCSEELVFESGDYKLSVGVDFFAPPKTVHVS